LQKFRFFGKIFEKPDPPARAKIEFHGQNMSSKCLRSLQRDPVRACKLSRHVESFSGRWQLLEAQILFFFKK